MSAVVSIHDPRHPHPQHRISIEYLCLLPPCMLPVPVPRMARPVSPLPVTADEILSAADVYLHRPPPDWKPKVLKPPTIPAKWALIQERSERVWNQGWTHPDYKAYVFDLRVSAWRKMSDRSLPLPWDCHAYEKAVFRDQERRAALHDWFEPLSFPDGVQLRKEAVLRDVSEILNPVPGDCLRYGIDNFNLPCSISTERGYRGHSFENGSASVVKQGPPPDASSSIIYPSGALGPETRGRMHRVVLYAAPFWDLTSELQLNCVVTGDYHGLALLCTGGELEEERRYFDPPRRTHCFLTGLPINTPPTAPLFGQPLPRVDIHPVFRTTLSKAWRNDHEVAALAVSPGFWHGCGTLTTHLSKACGVWPGLRAHMEKIPNLIMNDAISISGCEYLNGDRPGTPLPAELATWVSQQGLAALFNARRSSDLRDVVKTMHSTIIDKAPQQWTEGCFGLYVTADSAAQLFDGNLTAFKERIVERAHQPLKAAAPHSRHQLRWMMGRARFEEKRRASRQSRC